MLYESFKIKNLTFKNRIVMPPMCMYEAKEDGMVQSFHRSHYAARAVGGVGLIIQESTAVLPDGRITTKDLGIWTDDHIPGLKEIVDIIHEYGAVAGIQINHAGRKARVEHPVAPSALTYGKDYKVPKEMDEADISLVITAFKEGARRAHLAGYDLLEIHAAHGYLLCQFLSPLSNHRNDQYKDKALLLEKVIEAVRTEWPKDKVLCIRFSADEYVLDGLKPKDIAQTVNRIKHLGVDLIDVSSGGNVIVKIPAYPGYQLPLSKTIKELTNLPTIGGGLVTSLELAEFGVSSNHADMIYLGRLLLREPYFAINNLPDEKGYPEPYIRGKK